MNNTTPTAALKALHISTRSLGNWKKGTIPSGDIILKLSTHLNVSCDFLLKGIAQISNDTLSDGEYNIISMYRQINQKGKQLVQDSIRSIWKENQSMLGVSSALTTIEKSV